MKSDCPFLQPPQRLAPLGLRDRCPRRSQSAGRRGSRRSGKGGWGKRTEQVSCGNSGVSSAEAWPCWLPLPLAQWWKLIKQKDQLPAPTALHHWAQTKMKKSVTASILYEAIQIIARFIHHVYFFVLMRKKLHTCVLSCSDSLLADSPLRSHGMKRERIRVKDDHSTLLSLWVSGYRDATAALQWHFLPRCAEGRGFYLLAELRSFHLCAAAYSPRLSGSERAWLTTCSKTHTNKGMNMCTAECALSHITKLSSFFKNSH